MNEVGLNTAIRNNNVAIGHYFAPRYSCDIASDLFQKQNIKISISDLHQEKKPLI